MTVVARFDDLVPGTATKVDIDGVAVAVVRIGDDVYASVTCAVMPTYRSATVRCGATRTTRVSATQQRVQSRNRCAATLPATQPVPVFSVSVVNGDVVVEARS